MKNLILIPFVLIFVGLGLIYLVIHDKVDQKEQARVSPMVDYNVYIVGDSVKVIDPINGSTILKESLEDNSTLIKAILKDNQ